ncbi:MAG: pyridoxamine 5'-phosphate oxidase family protein [Haloarculaceae archaeon]
MALKQETEMGPSELDEFLASHETGVLSLARGGEPYAIPISYGYDGDDQTFFLRLVSTPESEKRQFLATSPRARLVVYDEADDTYRSVVAVGALETVPREELTVDRIEQYGHSKRPLFEIWAEGKADLDIELYEFRPAQLSGRRVEIEREA